MASDVWRGHILEVSGEEIDAIATTLPRMDPLRYYGAAIEAHYRWIEQQAIRGADRLSQEILRSLENLTVSELREVLGTLESHTMGRLRTVWRRLVSPRGGAMLNRLLETMPIEECRGCVGRATLGQVSLVSNLVEQAQSRRAAAVSSMALLGAGADEKLPSAGDNGCSTADVRESGILKGQGLSPEEADEEHHARSSSSLSAGSMRVFENGTCSCEPRSERMIQSPGQLENNAVRMSASHETAELMSRSTGLGHETVSTMGAGVPMRTRVAGAESDVHRRDGVTGGNGYRDAEHAEDEGAWDDMDVAYLLLLLLDNEYRETVWEDYEYLDYFFADDDDGEDDGDENGEHAGQNNSMVLTREYRRGEGTSPHEEGGSTEVSDRDAGRSRAEWQWVAGRYRVWMGRRRGRPGRGRGGSGRGGEGISGHLPRSEGLEGEFVGEHLQANLISSLLHLGLNIPGILNGPDIQKGAGNEEDASLLARVRAYVDLIGRLQQVADELSSRAGIGVGIGRSGGFSGVEPGPPPASGAAIASLPAVTVMPSSTREVCMSSSNSQEHCSPVECSICRELLDAWTTGRQMPCGHVYHQGCIFSWLKRRNSCPVCRYELPTDDAKYELEKRLQRSSWVGVE
ncbi:hypothetical protein CBR_g19973 [Chara braunii]|uniref:RING-type domain-containing protein n=1 Tax=Chara braunii TaxID=69332 RepID=A0A388KZ64_CHABU|nr:hypothetical protein CBR_g19973 [Chara braunii]|eukprot:GBG75339.1 hypothetical protein CBR_g19973 [Chara braunii]